jgi:hypothetical protein
MAERLTTYLALLQALAIAVVATVIPLCTPTRGQRDEARRGARTAAALLIAVLAQEATIDDVAPDAGEYSQMTLWRISGAIALGTWAAGAVLAILAMDGQIKARAIPLATVAVVFDMTAVGAALLSVVGAQQAALRREWQMTCRHLERLAALGAAPAAVRLHLVVSGADQALCETDLKHGILGKRAE